MGISIQKFLSKYYSPEDLRDILDDIGEPLGGTKKDRIERIIANWQSYNRDWYALLDYLDWGTLADICDDFAIPYSDYSKEDTLILKIEDERVLDFRKETMTKQSQKLSYTSNKPTLHMPHSNLAKAGAITSIVALPLGIFFGLWGSGFIDFSEIFCETGEDGFTYRNCNLDFQITRPNSQWYFEHDINNLKLERTGTPTESTFLGGTYMSTKGIETVFVAVFEPSGLGNKTLVDYAYDEIEWIKQNRNGVLIDSPEIGNEGNWVLFSIEGKYQGVEYYGEQILELRDDKLYMFQYTGPPIDERTEEKKEDLKRIIDSFHPI